MGKPITNVTIVGGGTAGWIVAAYLNHRLQWGMTGRPDVRITVIESPHIPTIGVGEATVPTLKGTLRVLQISEDEFVARTDATIKLGIRFDGWQARSAPMHSYLSPFTSGRQVAGNTPAQSFLTHGLDPLDHATPGEAFYGATGTADAVIRGMKGPRALDGLPYSGLLQYAYHVDAAKLADFFKEVCLARGVVHLEDEVTGLARDERGLIASLRLADRGDWRTELVIDCTGFRGVVINHLLNEPFDPLSDYLLDDRAIPLQVERAERTIIPPVTVARALDAGWSWRIPLHGRDGAGYVYSSAFVSDDDALEELQGLLGDAVRLTAPRVIRMRVGRTRRSWVGNCIAIGSSSGFLEPLESTTILAIELASRWLLKDFPSTDIEPALARSFNRKLDNFYDEVRDFLSLHFLLNDREDTPYWRAARHDVRRSDRLVENLALWRHRLPVREDLGPDAPFGHLSVQGTLIGKGFYDTAPASGVGAVSAETWRRHLSEVALQKKVLHGALPDHFALLEAIRARAVAGESRDREPGRNAVDEDALLGATQLLREG